MFSLSLTLEKKMLRHPIPEMNATEIILKFQDCDHKI